MLSKRKKHFREKGSLWQTDYGPYYSSVIGREGVSFFRAVLSKKFLLCLYLLSAVSSVGGWCCVGVLFPYEKKRTKDFASLALLNCFLVAFFRISFI